MRVGYIDKKVRNYAFIMGDDPDDPDAWIADRDVDKIPPHGTMVLYLPKRTRNVWRMQLCDGDLSKVFGQQRNRNPSVWMSGTIQRCFLDYCFITRDVGEPNVMCMPSTIDGNYKAIQGDRVRFRAGPSEKDDVPYLQAIRVIGPSIPTQAPSIPTQAPSIPTQYYDITTQDAPNGEETLCESDTMSQAPSFPTQLYEVSTTQDAPVVEETIGESDTMAWLNLTATQGTV